MIGRSFSLDVAGGVPSTAAFLISAFHNTTWASLPLPVDLGMFGAPNCLDFTSTDTAALYVLGAQGSVSVPWSVPNNALARSGQHGMIVRPMEAPSRPTRPQILAELRTFVADWFRDGRGEGLEPDTPLVTSGIVDSAGVLELVEFLERRFGAKIQESDLTLRNCNTLEALTELVEQRR